MKNIHEITVDAIFFMVVAIFFKEFGWIGIIGIILIVGAKRLGTHFYTQGDKKRKS